MFVTCCKYRDLYIYEVPVLTVSADMGSENLICIKHRVYVRWCHARYVLVVVVEFSVK